MNRHERTGAGTADARDTLFGMAIPESVSRPADCILQTVIGPVRYGPLWSMLLNFTA